MGRDIIKELCDLVKQAGLTMTLYGKPVTEGELRKAVEGNVNDRLRILADEATHRCKLCGALWRLNPPTEVQPEGSWSVLTPSVMRKCCDQEPMGDQIERL